MSNTAPRRSLSQRLCWGVAAFLTAVSLATITVRAQEGDITPVVKQVEEILKKHKGDKDKVSSALKALDGVLGPYRTQTVDQAIDDLNAWIDSLVTESDKTAALEKLNSKKLTGKISSLRSEGDLDRVKRLTTEITAAFGSGRFKPDEKKALEDEAGKIAVVIDQFLNKASDAYVDRTTDALIAWIASVAKDDKKSEAALIKTNAKKLVESLRALHPDDLARVVAIAAELNERLGSAKFSASDYDQLIGHAALTTLGQRFDTILTTRGPSIHIVRATYGDHRTGRICDAFHYFRGKCEGKASCPADSEIDGKKICNSEPAETAPARALVARVTFKCVSFTMRKLDAIDCAACDAATETKTVNLQGNAKIMCRVQP